MKCCFSSAWFVVRVFSASASCALADSSAPMRSRSLASRSAVSMRASTCPACTVSPSRTVICRTSPDTLALTVAWRTGCSAPETGSQRESGRRSTTVRSAGANSSVTVAAPLPSSFLARRIATLPPMAPMITSATMPPISRRRVNTFAMHAPKCDRRFGDPGPLTGRPGLAGPAGFLTRFVPWDSSSRLDARESLFGFGKAPSLVAASASGKVHCDGMRPSATGSGAQAQTGAAAVRDRAQIDMRTRRANNYLLPIWPTPFQRRK